MTNPMTHSQIEQEPETCAECEAGIDALGPVQFSPEPDDEDVKAA